jgi:hypothetical protein
MKVTKFSDNLRANSTRFWITFLWQIPFIRTVSSWTLNESLFSPRGRTNCLSLKGHDLLINLRCRSRSERRIGAISFPDRPQLSQRPHACKQTHHSSCREHAPCGSPEDMQNEALHIKVHWTVQHFLEHKSSFANTADILLANHSSERRMSSSGIWRRVLK